MSYTVNSRANNPQQGGREATGAVTSDSLAAQSMREGGGFSENENAHELGVKGSNSTFNTTDTSAATALQPAADGASREKQDALGLGADEKGVTGLKYPEAAGQPQFDGVHSSQGYAGGPGKGSSGYNTTTGGTYSGASGDSFADGGNTSGSGSGNTSSGSRGETYGTAGQSGMDAAPNYAATVSGAIHREGQFKPKGANLTEGDIPETKTFTGNVGGQYDPGRVAEQGFQKTSADDTVSAGQPKYNGSGQDSSTGGQYDVLSSERAPDRNY